MYRNYLNCAVCGCLLTASIKKKKYTYYYCTNAKKICKQNEKYIREKEMNNLVGELLSKFTIDEELATLSLELYAEELKKENTFDFTQKQIIQQQIEDIGKKLSKLLDRHLDE